MRRKGTLTAGKDAFRGGGNSETSGSILVLNVGALGLAGMNHMNEVIIDHSPIGMNNMNEVTIDHSPIPCV